MTAYEENLTETVYCGYYINAEGNADRGVEPLGGQPSSATHTITKQKYPRTTGTVSEGERKDADGNIIEQWKTTVCVAGALP